MNEADWGIAARIQRFLHVDISGEDNDKLDVVVYGRYPETALLGKAPHGKLMIEWLDKSRNVVAFEDVTLPDGTPFTQDDLQLAFQTAHIAAYGMCVIDVGYYQLAKEYARSDDRLMRVLREQSGEK